MRSSRYHYLMKLVVISSGSFLHIQKIFRIFIVLNSVFNVTSNRDIFLPLICYDIVVVKLILAFSVTSNYRRTLQQRARYKFVLVSYTVYIHITHRCAISFTFSRIPLAIFSWVTTRKHDSYSHVQVPAVLSLYLLHPNLMCGLILRSRDRVMLIATYKNDGSSFFSIIAFRLLLNAYIFSAIEIEGIIHQIFITLIRVTNNSY